MTCWPSGMSSTGYRNSISQILWIDPKLATDELDVQIREIGRAMHFDERFATAIRHLHVSTLASARMCRDPMGSEFLEELTPFHIPIIKHICLIVKVGP